VSAGLHQTVCASISRAVPAWTHAGLKNTPRRSQTADLELLRPLGSTGVTCVPPKYRPTPPIPTKLQFLLRPWWLPLALFGGVQCAYDACVAIPERRGTTVLFLQARRSSFSAARGPGQPVILMSLPVARTAGRDLRNLHGSPLASLRSPRGRCRSRTQGVAVEVRGSSFAPQS
jgi:hypothetical protein